MKPFRIPRPLGILFLIVVIGTFLSGTLHAFQIARASASGTPTATTGPQPGNDSELTPEPVATPVPRSADTTGIIALSIVIVIIVIAGTMIGSRGPRRKTPLE
jgi:hypothetical protein